MMTKRIYNRRQLFSAFTLAETVIAIILVGGLFVTAVDTVGATHLGMRHADMDGRAELFAQQLMSEILAKDYEEQEVQPKFGLEGLESSLTRTDYDDVDDYNGWSSFPPKRRKGESITCMELWGRTVTVEFAVPDDLMATSASDQGVKRITVQVKYNGATVATLVAIRAAALDEMR